MRMHHLPGRLLGVAFWGGAGCLVLLLAGCGSGTIKPAAQQARAFDTAPAAVKQVWDKALNAERTKDYMTAEDSLESLRKMDLTGPQKQAADAELSNFQQRLYQAAEKGDPAALKAVREINARYKR